MGWDIHLECVSASYEQHQVLYDINLTFKAGEFIGLIGPNGAGKSSLLTLINGFLWRDSGEIRLNNQVLALSNRRKLVKKIGYVPQSVVVNKRIPLLVKEVVLMGCFGQLGIMHLPKKAQKDLAYDLMAQVGILSLADKPVGHLSGGEMQKMAIARALMQDPEVLLLDEPTASLDWCAGQEIIDLIHKIHQQYNLTTLLVTHEINQLPCWCDKTVLLKHGRVLRQGLTEDLFQEDILSDLYALPVKVVNDGSRMAAIYGRN
ncbi:MAG: metal ABC transporter ATP-binding protein [bacterium]